MALRRQSLGAEQVRGVEMDLGWLMGSGYFVTWKLGLKIASKNIEDVFANSIVFQRRLRLFLWAQKYCGRFSTQ